MEGQTKEKKVDERIEEKKDSWRERQSKVGRWNKGKH